MGLPSEINVNVIGANPAYASVAQPAGLSHHPTCGDTQVGRPYQLMWRGRPSSYPELACTPTTASSWNSSRFEAPA
jgi:hypothetical protein